MAKTTAPVLDANLRTLLEGFRDTIDAILSGGGINGKSALSAQDKFRAELDGMDLAALRKLAIGTWNFAKSEVAKTPKDLLIDNLVSAKFEEDDDTDEEPADDEADEIEAEELEIEDDAEEEDEEEEVTVSREDLEAMNLRTLRKFARDNAGMTAADYKELDTDELIDAILGDADDSEEEDADEDDEDEMEIDDEADDEEGDEDEGDEEFYTADELKAMKIGELRDIAKDAGLRMTKALSNNKDAIIKKLLAA